MELKIVKKDIYWGYFSQIFSIASGIVILPIILNLLSPQEVGLNYLMLTVGTLVTLFDFGFAPQFGRNITYVFGGAQKLMKEGVDQSSENYTINYQLLANMIQTARFLYRRLSLIVLVTLLTGGSWYMYVTTDNFTSVDNALIIWLIYCISVYFNMYFAYYSSLLNGKGMITEHRKALLYGKVVYTVVAIVLLFCDVGLLSVVIANLLTPFVVSYLSQRYFFTIDLKAKLEKYEVDQAEIKNLILIVWFNAKKLGLVYLGSFAITRIGIFIAGLFLKLEEVASYGLMVQLVGLIGVVASTICTLYQPRFSFLRTQNRLKELFEDFSYTVVVFILLFTFGTICFLLLRDLALSFIGSGTTLPSLTTMIIYSIAVLLEIHYQMFTSFLITNNEVPMVKATLISSFFIGLLTYLELAFTDYGLLGLVCIPLIIQSFYNNWKWVIDVLKYFQITYYILLSRGSFMIIYKLKTFLQ